MTETDVHSRQGDSQQTLSFRCMQTPMAIPIVCVREIIEYGQLTVVPLMPAYIKGVLNLRGHVVPVIDLALRLGGTPTEISKRTCIIILDLPVGDTCQQAGLIVDAVDEVLDIYTQDIEPPPEFGTHFNVQFIAGMARMDNGFTILLKADGLFTTDELQRMYDQSASAG